METKIIHRKFKDGSEFRAIETTLSIKGKVTNLVYGTSISFADPHWSETLELYRGANYVVDSKDKSWSRCYSGWLELIVPNKYLDIMKQLKTIHTLTNFDSSSIDYFKLTEK